MITFTCERDGCGVVKSVKPRGARRPRFCSRRCAGLASPYRMDNPDQVTRARALIEAKAQGDIMRAYRLGYAQGYSKGYRQLPVHR